MARPALLLALAAAAALVGGVGGQAGGAAPTQAVAQALQALQAATEKLELDEDKLAKAQQAVARDQDAVQDDLHAVNHPAAVGLASTEAVVRQGQLDTQKLQADRPRVPVLEAIVEEDKKRLVQAELAYERALRNAPPPPPPPPPPTALPPPDLPAPRPAPAAPSTPASASSPWAQRAPHAGDGAAGQGSGPEGGAGGAHYDSSPYYPSRHWASCPPCSNGSPQEIADWLETTIEGAEWIESQDGLAWLLSDRGQQWLATPQGAEWPFTQAGESFLSSEWGRKFLASQAGQAWLRSPPGLRWLREHKPWAASSLRLRNAALASLLAVCVAGLLSAYLVPLKDAAPADSGSRSVAHSGPLI
jgi:hypothetical protein